MVRIISCDSSHVEDLLRIAKVTFTDTYAAKNSAEGMRDYLALHFTPAVFEAQLSDKNSLYFLAAEGENYVGYLKLNFAGAQTEAGHPDSLEIERIYVLKEFHGAGMGQLLVEKAIEVARENELKYLWLGVWTENERARHAHFPFCRRGADGLSHGFVFVITAPAKSNSNCRCCRTR